MRVWRLAATLLVAALLRASALAATTLLDARSLALREADFLAS
jgi:hypothetical protein